MEAVNHLLHQRMNQSLKKRMTLLSQIRTMSSKKLLLKSTMTLSFPMTTQKNSSLKKNPNLLLLNLPQLQKPKERHGNKNLVNEHFKQQTQQRQQESGVKRQIDILKQANTYQTIQRLSEDCNTHTPCSINLNFLRSTNCAFKWREKRLGNCLVMPLFQQTID